MVFLGRVVTPASSPTVFAPAENYCRLVPNPVPGEGVWSASKYASPRRQGRRGKKSRKETPECKQWPQSTKHIQDSPCMRTLAFTTAAGLYCCPRVCCLLFVVCCVLSLCLLSAVCVSVCLLSAVCCLSAVCLLSVVCCLLSAVCCLLSDLFCLITSY